MSYIPPDTLAKIKQIDLFSYLKTYAPSELVRISGNVYRMRSHESLKISNGKWMDRGQKCVRLLDQSRGIFFSEGSRAYHVSGVLTAA